MLGARILVRWSLGLALVVAAIEPGLALAASPPKLALAAPRPGTAPAAAPPGTALAAPAPGTASSTAPAPRDWAVPGGHFFTQGNGFPLGTSPMGYAIVDDDNARFWTAYQRAGGEKRFGYPVSQRLTWEGFLVQVTQKAILQWRPETQSVDYVNVFDDLDRLGKNGWLQAFRSIPAPLGSTFDQSLDWKTTMRHRVDLLKVRPALYAAYASAPDALDRFGLPTSPVVDAGPMYVVRLQRAVLQEWKVKEPWADVGQVTVANGGDVAKDAGVLPFDAVRPKPPPPGTWTPAPGEYRLTGHGTWYDLGFAGKPMANGQSYLPTDPTTTAANAFPLGSVLRVTDEATGKTIVVTVRDTGAFAYPDVLDLSPAAFVALGVPTPKGVTPISVELIVPSASLTVVGSPSPSPTLTVDGPPALTSTPTGRGESSPTPSPSLTVSPPFAALPVASATSSRTQAPSAP